MVVCVVCGKDIPGSLRRLLHPPSSDGVKSFYIAHLNPLLDTSIKEQTFTCRQPSFAKLEQALKHTAKANALLRKLKAMDLGTGASSSTDHSRYQQLSFAQQGPDLRSGGRIQASGTLLGWLREQ